MFGYSNVIIEGTAIHKTASPRPYTILAHSETKYHVQSSGMNAADAKTTVDPLNSPIATVSAFLRPNLCKFTPIIGAKNMRES